MCVHAGTLYQGRSLVLHDHAVRFSPVFQYSVYRFGFGSSRCLRISKLQIEHQQGRTPQCDQSKSLTSSPKCHASVFRPDSGRLGRSIKGDRLSVTQGSPSLTCSPLLLSFRQSHSLNCRCRPPHSSNKSPSGRVLTITNTD